MLKLHAKEAFERLYDTMIVDEYEHYMESYEEAPDPSDLPTEELKEHHYTCLRILKDWFIEEVGKEAFDEKKIAIEREVASSHFWVLYNDIEKDHRMEYECDGDPDEIDIEDLEPCTYKDLRILVSYWEETEESQSQEETQESQSQGFGMAPEEFQKNFEKSLNISEKR